MAKRTLDFITEISVEELKAALAQKEELVKLEQARDRLAGELAQVEKQINGLLQGFLLFSTKRPGPKPGNKRGRKPGVKQAMITPGTATKPRPAPLKKASIQNKGGAPAKPQRGPSMSSLLVEILKPAKGPVRVAELAKMLLKDKGYQTKSKNFYAVVINLLKKSPLFKRDPKGGYMLNG